MMHDFGLSERNVVLFDLPCIFSLDAVAEGAAVPLRLEPRPPGAGRRAASRR